MRKAQPDRPTRTESDEWAMRAWVLTRRIPAIAPTCERSLSKPLEAIPGRSKTSAIEGSVLLQSVEAGLGSDTHSGFVYSLAIAWNLASSPLIIR